MWRNLDKTNPDGAHYSIIGLERGVDGTQALRTMFPDAKANDMNFVLFSTSGVHGTYNLIEEAERFLSGDQEACGEVTFLIVHPRLVCLRYGVCRPQNQDDIDFLKRLRASSHTAVAGIVFREQPADERKDAELLDALRDNSWGLVPVNVPTGGDDDEIQWQVIEYHMAKPTERVIAQAANDEPRVAIRAALAQQSGKEAGDA